MAPLVCVESAPGAPEGSPSIGRSSRNRYGVCGSKSSCLDLHCRQAQFVDLSATAANVQVSWGYLGRHGRAACPEGDGG
jgi:hypothetical protein